MTGRQQKALSALIRAPTLVAAAAEAGVGVSTLRRWMREKEFAAAYRAALDELLKDASAQSKKALTTALDVLVEIMQDGDAPAAARIAASKTTLEISLKLHEAVDVTDRLSALEKMIGDEP